MSVYRIYVEKKPEFAVEAKSLAADIRSALGIELGEVRIINRYDAEGLSEEDFNVLDEALEMLLILKRKKGKTNEQILREIVKIVQLLSTFFK